ncbi:multifunctional oxoglutarate decarboxylase/oxoglutarate dehydrogenase thiamine pyrophosphate-binding subunit/dihydrolipoyllysine-residue succinyltransferase subunit [Serinibacter arcticus]|uniref:Multifunctional oxoglutarate decarboxylase/oxoglutarate dehydrogenase thiamine pyrophosphate-binding subunit/dihydrolipoyllysine-residue succinyltransferase subunit n=1 Tax=Serinibacter arcticus TaxID=1655435 RepID=A0A2U1ZYV3_9MICO|nr:multifunctional oxoglutarate decarboxylase/oxoglutarate dehydrogenase thiamine pyrophosphate-binding subunit/dihydrolipoyllysine-residue succinyltransferase subunit [Serinibacter arcticus]PWD52161.1 multifunctional oxoglutarate decarboxylase/oxoglutarate dehydrogenase thiamine pyrophosphate-binding subunit/dihydrolipoyllysine-residue succinyltransferase subunit [Serinibacter arcticus]
MASESPATPTTADFGANEWLIDELRVAYEADPASVDAQWREFFAAEGRTPAGGTANGAATVTTAPADPPAATTAPEAPAPAAAPAAARPAPARPAPRAEDPHTDPRRQLDPQDVRADLPPAVPQPATAPYVPGDESHTQSPLGDGEVTKLRGPSARVVTNMEASLEVPTATSVRAVPAKLLVDNRIVVNNHLVRTRGGKVSFTHLIGFAVVEALLELPEMNAAYREIDGKPGIYRPEHVNFGLAIDLAKPDGTRQLLVPSIKHADTMDFAQFWSTYEALVKKARGGKLTVEDFADTTISLTNPGTIGTVHSVPRLMQGQGTIVGVGAMDYPAEFQGASPETLANLGISKVLTLTSTYDHRIIQGAQSGDFLRLVHTKLLGEDGFYDRVFAALRVPYEPVRWRTDIVEDPTTALGKPARIAELIHAYRSRGHLMADTDPLAYRQRRHPDLDVANHSLTLWDLDRTFPTGGFTGKPTAPLRDVLARLRDAYCRTIGSEYMHLHDPAQRRWLQQKLEGGWPKPSPEAIRQIMHKLNQAEAFETFLQTKFVGQKRFSLEGGESLIPLMDTLLAGAADAGLEGVGIGMAHRGRLNVLANIAGKSYGQIFNEFEGNVDPKTVQGSGDVKYHLGTVGEYTSPTGSQTSVYLAANPSHLEAVNGVLEGVVRAKQDRIDLGGDGFSWLPVLIHGDAAFAGQGVVVETLNLSQLRGYRTGGTVHIIINNQVGFTTGASSSRSTLYPTDVAKGLQIPVFHVNGDDPEAVARVARLAFEYREEFHKDVVIDMVCYRRRGHNEGDDPSMTQPVMYSLIEGKQSVRTLYTQALIGRGDLSAEEADQLLADYQGELERAFRETKEGSHSPSEDDRRGLEVPESQREDAGTMVGWTTSVPESVLHRIGDAHLAPPEGFAVHPKLAQLLERRATAAHEGSIDWGFGELLAFGSLVLEGTPVRLSGQDSRRGTFVQRHSVLHDHHTGAEWTPLSYLSADQAKFWVYDSSLSEFASLGFEYGYSVERPDALVLWEAQFGDFVNGAQTIVDEFISASEQKWGQRSSVVLLLPHGYEHQGPDHSSARIERFLQLSAENNMTVAQPSTPASYFHLLRRQAYDRPRKPLIVFTPKQLLRLRAATSSVEDFTTGTFRTAIGDTVDPGKVDRVLMCSGRVYYDLLAARTKGEHGADERTAIVRLEQLYPLDSDTLREVIAPYGDAELVWVQDEPANQGVWPYLAGITSRKMDGVPVRRVSRPSSAAPSTGSAKVSQAEQQELVREAFAR